MSRLISLSVLAILALSGICEARKKVPFPCLSVSEARNYVGSERCITGTVMAVEEGEKGTVFLTFCRDKGDCPFSVVVFPADLKKMGDIHLLEGRQVEMIGTIQQHDGRAEIVLRHTQQLGESAYVLIPRVPTEYDVEKVGHGRAGSIRKAKASRKKAKRQGEPTSIDDPNEPQ